MFCNSEAWWNLNEYYVHNDIFSRPIFFNTIYEIIYKKWVYHGRVYFFVGNDLVICQTT